MHEIKTGNGFKVTVITILPLKTLTVRFGYVYLKEIQFLLFAVEPFEGFLALSNDSLVLLSSTQKIAGNANRTCSEFYGTIASIGRNDLNHQILINTYTKGKEFS